MMVEWAWLGGMIMGWALRGIVVSMLGRRA